MKAAAPHPLMPLSIDETDRARDIVLNTHHNASIYFRVIDLLEPPKAELTAFLNAEHTGKLSSDTPRPARVADVKYDAIEPGSKNPVYQEAWVDIDKKEIVHHELISTEFHASLTVPEFRTFVEVCGKSTLFQQKIEEFKLPSGFEVVIEPWPYGGLDAADENRRYFQGLIFAADTTKNNKDTNFYSYPLPIIPIMDWAKKEIIRIDELATGGTNDPLTGKTHSEGVLDHCASSEYVPELLGEMRKDLKPLNVSQPDGPSFSVSDNSLVEWQKWRFRVSFNPREGAVIHDVHYDGRSVVYRLAFSEMSVPYADPRPPFHRKQAFDFGDGGLGHCVNNLQLGCDCLGVIKYLDGVVNGSDGKGEKAPNVICIHEQDNGINWKHTNWRTGRAVVTRRRELVVQFIITLANYEYVFAFKFDQAGGIVVETRATGIVSVVNIDPGKTAEWGNVVSPGTLAQNHQHAFCLRIDPAIDGHKNTVVYEESHPMQIDPKTNPNGNRYEVRKTPITTSAGFDVDPLANRTFKVQNWDKKNPISGKPVGYKIVPPATQKLLAAPNSLQYNRALFAQHHMWVTKYQDNELYAAGRFTMQSRHEHGGVTDMVKRNDSTVQEDVVLWNVFTLTHNPRVEDWPVMPVEIHQVSIVPTDFFTGNPAIDVPSSKNEASQLAACGDCNGTNGHAVNGNGVNGHATNGNGTAPVNGIESLTVNGSV